MQELNKVQRKLKILDAAQGEIVRKFMLLLMLWEIPLLFFFTPGQASDLEGADVLLPQVKTEAVLGDKAYDADERVILPLEARNIQAIIPSKKNRLEPRIYDKYLYLYLKCQVFN